MAIESTIFRVQYAGNNSTVTAYPIPFPFFADTDIVVETLADGDTEGEDEVTLDPSAYTVTQLDDRTGSLVTDAAIPTDSVVTISRATAIVQPTVYPESGPFPAASHEAALDRVTMIAQEIAGGAGGGVLVAPVALRDVVRWEEGTDRPGVVPARRGQLGVQMADRSLWMAESTTAGDWAAVAGGGGGSSSTVAFDDADDRTSTEPAFVGQLGVQLDSGKVYSAVTLTVGDWALISQAQTAAKWANDAARATADPDYIGQVGVQLDNLTMWIANDLSAGSWSLLNIGAQAAEGTAETAGIAIWTDAAARASKVPAFVNQLGIQTGDRTMWLATGTSAGNWAAFSPGGNASSASVAISGTEIGWTLGRTFYKTLSGDHAFTFAGSADGMCIVVMLTNSGSHTPTWPAGVAVDWVTDDGVSVITFININGTITSSTVFRAA